MDKLNELREKCRDRSHFATCKNAAHHRKPASTDAPKTKRGKNAPAAIEKPPTSTLF